MAGRYNASTIHETALAELRQYYAYLSNSDVVSLAVAVQSADASDITANAQAGMVNSLNSALAGTQAGVGDIDEIQTVMNLILDITEGAYFTHNFLNQGAIFDTMKSIGAAPGFVGTGVSSAVQQYVNIVYEGSEVPGVVWTTPSEFNGNYIGMRRQVAPVDLISLGQYEFRSFEQVNINQNTGNPDKYTAPSLSAFTFPNIKIGPSTRNTDSVGIFANGIPNIELSRCVPFLNVSIFTDIPSSGIQADANGQLGLLRFLGAVDAGSVATTSDLTGLANTVPENVLESAGIGTDVASGLLSNSGVELEGARIGSAGMEIFTSPMTLTNADMNASGFISTHYGNKEILDPLRPLLTLESFNIALRGMGQEMLASKTATLNVTLHDRSRMADIAPLISADRYANTHLVIEYGWSHPDGGPESENSYGRFLNTLRTKELFNITHSEMSLDSNGQVSITMKLAVRGGTLGTSCPIVAGKYVPLRIARSLLERYLATVTQSAANSNSGNTTLVEVRNKLDLGTGNADGTANVVPRAFVSELLYYIRQGDTTYVVDLVQQLVGEDGEGGLIADQTDTVGTEINNKIQALYKGAGPPELGGIDVWLSSIYLERMNHHSFPTIDEDDPRRDPMQYTSFGKIVMSFIGYPIASCMTFDEVQVMFYGFNAQAGLARRYNICHFPIRIANFQSKLLALANSDHEFSASPRTQDIIDILSTYVSNPMNAGFGLYDLYESYTSDVEAQQDALGDEATPADRESYQEWQQSRQQVLSDSEEQRLRALYREDGHGGSPEFTVPNVSFYFESVPALTQGEGDSTRVKTGGTVLRIHVFDKSATPHVNELFQLKMANDSEVASQYAEVSAAYTEYQDAEFTQDLISQTGAVIPMMVAPPSLFAASISEAKENAYTNELSDYRVYVNTIPAYAIKEKIKTTVPSITMGSMFNAIKNVSVSSTTSGQVQNERLVTANIEREDSQVDLAAASSVDDIFVIPATMNMTLFGMPLLNYGQEFYVDLGTGTTLDNMYAVTDLTHKIDGGGFETSFKCTFRGSGTTRNLRASLVSSLPVIQQEEDEST